MTRFASASPGARAAAVALGGLAALSLLAVLALLIALVGLGQFSDAIDPARVPAWLWYYRHDPEVRRWLTVGVSVSALVGVVLVAAVLLTRRRPLHGAARWASGSEQRRAGLRAHRGIVLGRADGGFLIADGPEHVMLYAPTRTGKGVGVVIPNLLAWPDSVVVLDIKRENFLATAGYRAEAGQTVHLFDPLARDGRTARFNPLGHVDRADPIAVLDELQRMAVMLFPVHERADPFWAEASRTGFIGVGGYVAATAERPFTLGEIFRQLTAGDARARLPRIVAAREQEGRPLPGPVVAALTDFTSSSENTFASVRQSITTRMGLWLNPRVDAATAASDFDLRDLRGGRLSLYLGATPDNMLRIQPLYALLFQQLVDLNSRALPGPADRPALIVLDEFARLGPAPVLAHAFAWVAGYGLRLLAVLQSPAQLRAIYGPDVAEEVMTNCGVEIVFAPKELKIAQELSDRLGAYTTDGRSRSRPTGLSPGRRSTTVSDQRRALMLPQELMQLPQPALIVLKAGLPPVRGRKIAYFRERAFQRRLRPAPDLAPVAAPTSPPVVEEDPMDFDVIARAFAAEGLPPPKVGADEDAVGAWLDRVVDTAVLEREP
ncbi:type IV secretion system protein VirD4 [Brevundimonas alba]|uniref:Type IV secretion system protein VirD4 n=1 Tax=Brevundimonas alba TaxID=74314 RepID=A0A7X5YMS2_9CAUL|nr:type IV secretory system conjugative DNA transfer family protein [Brevundimonas alba]NJC42046.1 type IV secretion system protein VirD4 [Brevundimonas alba]